MNRALAFALLLAAVNASAQVMRGPASWSNPLPPAAASSIGGFVLSGAADGSAYPGLVASLRGALAADPNSPALAPVADALAAQPEGEGAVTPARFEKALVAASRAVQAGAQELVWAKAPADAAGFDARSASLSGYAANYGAYMAPHELSALRDEADAAKTEAARLRGEKAGDAARRDGDALGQGRKPEEVPGSASTSGGGLSKPTERGSSADQPLPPAPQAPAKTDALANAAVYVGGGIVLTAMFLFLGTAWSTIGTGAALAASLIYMGAFFGGATLLKKKGFAVAAGVLATLVVAMGPVAVAAGLSLAGASAEAYAARLAVEAAAVIGAILVARRFQFGFLAMPAAASLFAMAVDFVAQVLPHNYSWGTAALFAGLGALMTLGGRVLDLRSKAVDYARWVYLAGLTAVTWGLGELVWDHHVLPRIAFGLAGAVLVAIGALIDRKSFAAYGGVALFGYLGWLLWDAFGGTLLAYFGMAGFGVGVIVLAVLYQKNAAALGAWLRGLLKKP